MLRTVFYCGTMGSFGGREGIYHDCPVKTPHTGRNTILTQEDLQDENSPSKYYSLVIFH